MRHEFSPAELREAINHAHSKSFDMPPITESELRFMLEGLPEPTTDDWQECTIDQIRKGDRVRWQDPGMEDICTYEIIADHAEAEDPGWILFSRTESYYFPPGAVVDRIPAPVTHPDPAVHQYILVHEFKSENPSWVMPVLGYANDDQSGYYINGLFRHATEITEWQHLTPAKMVADDG